MKYSESSYYSDTSTNSYTSDEYFSNSDKINDTNINLEKDIINEYNIISLLGTGAYSAVWLVYSILDCKYYALKVQNYDDYEDGIDEVSMLKKIPKDDPHLNNLLKHFIEERYVNDKKRKFVCTVYNLCNNNLDVIIRKGNYNTGFNHHSKDIFKQICKGIETLHNKLKVFHGDLKLDNILLKGINKKTEVYINHYNSYNFNQEYKKLKEQFWLNKGKNISKIKNMKSIDKINIRKILHKNIMNELDLNKIANINNYEVDNQKFNISITDFGHYCPDEEIMNEKFGTQMYQSPEIILMGNCTKKVDIWALGCTLYEILTGELLFDPWGDDDIDTDLIHLHEIFNLFGKIDKNYLVNSKYYKRYFKGDKLRSFENKLNIKNETTFKLKLKQKLSNTIFEKDFNDIYSLLTGMLNPVAHYRYSINEVLDSDWLKKN